MIGTKLKRFTETLKWDDPWFRQLAGVNKLVFLYVIDRCNNAGFLEVDQDAMAWHTKVDPKHITGAVKSLERGIKEVGGWLWVRKFLKHQKNEPLNPENPAHKQIISLVSEQRERFNDCSEFKQFLRGIDGALKGLRSPIGTGKSKGEGKKRESPEREKQAAEIYKAYPRQEKRPEAIIAILKAMGGNTPDFLLLRTRLYASLRPRDQFTPLPASWFNQERFKDDEKNWKPQANGARQKQLEPAPTGEAYKRYYEAPPIELTDEQIAKNKAVIAEHVGKLTESLKCVK